jgi:hypothetical protein
MTTLTLKERHQRVNENAQQIGRESNKLFHFMIYYLDYILNANRELRESFRILTIELEQLQLLEKLESTLCSKHSQEIILKQNQIAHINQQINAVQLENQKLMNEIDFKQNLINDSEKKLHFYLSQTPYAQLLFDRLTNLKNWVPQIEELITKKNNLLLSRKK